VPVLLHAEADRLSPFIRHVVVVASRVDAQVAANGAGVSEWGRRDDTSGLGVAGKRCAEVLVRGGGGKRHACVNLGLVRSRADLTRKEVQADQRLDLELPALELWKEVGAAGDEHRFWSELGGHSSGLARGLRPQVLKSRQAQHDPTPWAEARP